MVLFKKLLVFLLLLLARPVFGQNNGALLPALPPHFTGPGANPTANGKLCFTASGTNINQAVFSDPALGSVLPNPVTLNAVGIPQTAGGQQTSIYINPAQTYRVTLYANGVGNACNGVPVGSLVWQRDGVFDSSQLVQFSNVKRCDQYGGTNAGQKIVACITDLGANGGIADARGFVGLQDVTTNICAA